MEQARSRLALAILRVAVALLAGIALIRFRQGWFVVGAGRTGMECSALLIVALPSIAVGEQRGPAPPEA